MEPIAANIPGHPEVIGRLDVDSGADWPPVVALFIDIGNTAPEHVSRAMEQLRISLDGLFPPGRTLYVPQRGAPSVALYRLEEEPPDPDVTEVMEINERIARELDAALETISELTAEVRRLEEQKEELGYELAEAMAGDTQW